MAPATKKRTNKPKLNWNDSSKLDEEFTRRTTWDVKSRDIPYEIEMMSEIHSKTDSVHDSTIDSK